MRFTKAAASLLKSATMAAVWIAKKIVQKAQQNGLLNNVDVSLLSDEQVYDLVFQPGFSTAETVSEVSGRGVGMDVVKRNIQALKGSVEIQSRKGHGSIIRIRLPLTLAIMDGQLVRVGQHIYIVPLISIVESMRYRSEHVNQVAGGCRVFQLRDEYVPLVELSQLLNISSQYHDLEQSLMVVVETEGGKVGIVVDELLAQQQVVIKSLEQNYRKVDGISGATILGDGTVALILDIPGIAQLAALRGNRTASAFPGQESVVIAQLKRA
ncbi:MAG: chemotaxis protein CheW [Cellvibrionaceae bacterium]|nr:chemotaxis protein CheW [Cellvibrionaceae bacterium]